MDARQLPRTDYYAIKGGIRHLVDLCGGPLAASRETRVSATMLSNYADPTKMDCFAPGDVIADLEAFCGQPVMTKIFADLHNNDLVPRASPTEMTAAHLARHLGDVSAAVSKIFERVGSAVADDEVTRGELLGIKELIAPAHTQLAELGRDIDTALEKMPPAGLRVVGG